MKIFARKSAYILLAALPLLASCGGGGGSSSPTNFPIDAAASAFYSSARHFSLTNHDTPDTLTITYDLTPGADAQFEGTAAKTLEYTAVLEENGVPSATAGGTDYFQVNPYRYLGTLYDDNTYEVAANQVNLPATATIGQSGNLYTSTTYTDTSKTAIEDTSTVRWSLERDSSSKSRAYFCVNQALPYTNPDDIASIASCYRINEAGSILEIRLRYVYADGTRVTFN